MSSTWVLFCLAHMHEVPYSLGGGAKCNSLDVQAGTRRGQVVVHA